MQQLEEESRHRAREARLAAAGGNQPDSDGNFFNEHPSRDDLMEIIEQGKAAIGKIWVA